MQKENKTEFAEESLMTIVLGWVGAWAFLFVLMCLIPLPLEGWEKTSTAWIGAADDIIHWREPFRLTNTGWSIFGKAWVKLAFWGLGATVLLTSVLSALGVKTGKSKGLTSMLSLISLLLMWMTIMSHRH